MLDVRPTGIAGVVEIRPARLGDERGFFSEVWSEGALAEAGITARFVQDNHSFSKQRGVLRGLHYQIPPAAQDKLVRVTRGSVFDVAVDIRSGSSTFGQWTAVVLSQEQWNQLYVPSGFAHGFVTLENDTEVLYKVTAPYVAELERGIRFDDPTVGIDWPIQAAELTLSAKDLAAPYLADAETGF